MNRIREVIVVEGKYDKNALAQVVDASVITLDGFAAFHDKEKLSFLRRLAEKRGLIILTDSDGAGFVLRNFLKGALPSGQVKHAYISDIPGKERRKRKPGKEGKLGVEGMRPEILLDALRRAGATFEEDAIRRGGAADSISGDAQASDSATGAAQASDSATGDAQASDSISDDAQASDSISDDAQASDRLSGDAQSPDGATGDAPITMADFVAWGLSGAENSAERRRTLLKRLDLPEKLNARALLDTLNLLYSQERLSEILREADAQSVGG